MKKQLLMISSLLVGLSSIGQNNYCSSDEMQRQAFANDPAYKQQYQNFRAFAKKYTEETFKPNEKGVVYQVPIVFHVIHNYGNENLSDAAIYNTLESMNDHWRKRLADSSQIEPPFNQIHDDMEVEFVLATKDPNGDCSTGITRHVSELTYSAGDNVKALTKAKLDWPCDQYLNVWIVSSIASGAGGYSYFPGVSCSIDGIVVLRNQLSALPHEAGHWLALPHPWGGTNDNNIPQNCNDDDGISDTPNTQGQSSCGNLLRTTCSGANENPDPEPFLAIDNSILWPASSGQIHDNVQNVMDYAFCGPENFTQGQKAVARAALESSTGGRNNLHTASNLQITGADGSSCSPAPIVDFDLEYEYICTEDFDNIIKNNTHNSDNISYSWTVEDAVISSTSAEEPSVNWSEPGFYDVSVVATSAGGSSNLTKTDVAKVVSSVEVRPFFESFASANFPVNDPNDFSKNWFLDVIGSASGNTFTRTTDASTEGNSSLKLNIKNSPGTHRILSPMIDMSQASCNELTFDLAYNKRSGGSVDRFKVRVSTSCGRTWSAANTMLELTANQMQTGTASISGEFIPATDEWNSYTIDMSKFAGKDIIVMFEVETANGNTLYLDNISFGCNEVPFTANPDNIEEKFTNLVLFPNPSSGDVNIRLNTSEINNTITITDVTGKLISHKAFNVVNSTVNTTISELTGKSLDKGVYFVNIKNVSQSKTEKLIIK